MVKMRMRGATLPGNSSVELKEFEIPKPGYGQVLIQTKATTICGSDIRCIYREHVGKGPEGYIPGLVCLKWAVQRGQVPIPFSVREEQYVSNLECVTGDPLTREEMDRLRRADQNCRLVKGQVFL